MHTEEELHRPENNKETKGDQINNEIGRSPGIERSRCQKVGSKNKKYDPGDNGSDHIPDNIKDHFKPFK